MGAKSTMYLTRERAMKWLLQNLYHATNRTLENMVEELNDQFGNDLNCPEEVFDFGLCNFIVVDKESEIER